MKQAKISTDDRKVTVAAKERAEKLHVPTAAIELADGTIITSKTTDLLGASAALLLNALKYLGEGKHVRVFYSLGEGYYCELENDTKDEAKLHAIYDEMMRLVEADIPIEKNSVKTEEAEYRFRDRGMKDKERLLHYRRSSRVNLYSLDGLEDYFYGYMVPSTGYLGIFDLQLYEEGIL